MADQILGMQTSTPDDKPEELESQHCLAIHTIQQNGHLMLITKVERSQSFRIEASHSQ